MFGAYKYILSCFTLLGMMFATMEIIIYPNVHNYNAGFLFFTVAEPFGIRNSTCRQYLLAAYTFFYAATVSLLSTQFIYRYWAIFDVKKLRFFQGVYWLFWPVFCSFFGLQYAIGALYFFEMDPVSISYFRDELHYRYGWNVSETPAMALVAFDPSTGATRWWNLAGILNICFIVSFQYGIMIYCGWCMHMRMEDKIKNFSEILKKHQKQFFKTLVLQITAPTLILFIPIFFIILLPIFDLHVSLPSGAILCSFTLYPAMDSLIVMYVVSEYRNTAKRVYGNFWRMVKDYRGPRGNAIAASSNLPTTPSEPPRVGPRHGDLETVNETQLEFQTC